MRIALVGPAPPFRGGIAQHTAALHEALAQHHAVQLHGFARLYPRLLFPGRSQTAPGDLAELPADVPFDPYSPRSWRRVAARIAAFDPDVVLVQWWHPWFAVPTTALLRRTARALGGRQRLALLCHNVLPHRAVPLQQTLVRMTLRACGRIVVHAAAEAALARALAPGVPLHHMHLPAVLPPPRTPLGRHEARARLGLNGGPWALCFGLVRRYKGLADMLHALTLPACRDVKLLVLGEFYESESRYRRLVERLGLAARVRMQNRYVPSAEVPCAFAAADVVVLPYRSATQSSVVPLAARARRPVVVTATGGLAEASEGIGRVVPPRDPAALAAAVAGVLEQPPCDEAAFAAAEQRFGLPAARAAIEQIAAAARPGGPEGRLRVG
jgi:glycosyltransferase involved in cell wall biosynthesis